MVCFKLNIRFIQVALSIFVSAIFMQAKQAQSQDLEESLRQWLAPRDELIKYSNSSLTIDDLKTKNALLKLEYHKRQIYFSVLAENYIQGRLKSQEIDHAFKSHHQYQKYMAHFSSILLMESVKRLKESAIPEIQSFMRRYDALYFKNTIPLFRITGSEISRESPTEEKGGFHRGHKSIFMDVTRLSSGEWLFIFMHELYHALDDQLYEAIVEFTNEDLVDSVKKMSKTKSNLVELTDEEMTALDRYATAGLNRNLFAEYRAWSFGFTVYEKGMEEKLWKKIPFIENVLSFKDKNESMNGFIYRYLNERAGLSKDNFLSRPIVAQKIAEKREQFDPK